MKVKRHLLEMVMTVIMLLSIFTNVNYILAKDRTVTTRSSDKRVVLIDAGHGGVDPGKVVTHRGKEICEKDINLLIASKLASLLSERGYTVYMTRDTDGGLYAEADKNKKKTDMVKRVQKASEVDADVMISIHANSFKSGEASGAQVFYYKGSNEGEILAMNIQDSLRDMDSSNARVHKPNDTYYLLKKTKCPSVIVECGFLTCDTEAELLLSDEYQSKLAITIGDGIDKYFTYER